jgi:hypothetical protein
MFHVYGFNIFAWSVRSNEVSINISCPCILHYLLGGMCGAMRCLIMFHAYGFNIFAWSVRSNEVSINVSCLWI